MPKPFIEYRVCYVLNLDGMNPSHVSVYSNDDWFGSGPDAAASYPWLMNNAIVWVEERINYEPEPWEPVGVDTFAEHQDTISWETKTGIGRHHAG